MKLINKIITAVIFISCYSFSYAQYQLSDSQQVSMQRTVSIHHQRGLKAATFVFEGIVISQECYYGKHTGILTCSVIQITKIFKGSPQIKLGSIKVITMQGGSVDGQMEKISDGGRGISKSGTYIIIGKTADSSMLNDKTTTTDNLIAVTTIDCSEPIAIIADVYSNGKLIEQSHAFWGDARFGTTQFKTLDELYSFLKEMV